VARDTSVEDISAGDGFHTDLAEAAVIEDVASRDSSLSLTWLPVPESAPCGLFVAANPDTVPLRTWISCGKSCLLSEIALPGYRGSEQYMLSAAYQDGSVYLRASMGTSGPPPRQALFVQRLPIGTTVAAFEQREDFEHCLFVGNASGAPFAVALLGPPGIAVSSFLQPYVEPFVEGCLGRNDCRIG